MYNVCAQCGHSLGEHEEEAFACFAIMEDDMCNCEKYVMQQGD